MFAADLGFDDFAANRGGSFFAAAVPGAPRSVDIVETRDAGVEAKILTKMAAHAFREKLFPTVAVFGLRGVSVFFLEGGSFERLLLIRVVDAGRRRIKKLLADMVLGSLEHVRIDEHGQHAQGFILFDEA